ncbi:MAG: hypothetical protein NZM42_09145 [Gemmatales bacterium]|nr:hypothetical protein [Gemmatales bacterium]MDW8223259.1 hypothetical protein [Gemmatales bacterium]
MLPARLKPIQSAYQRFRRDSEILSQLLAQPLTDQKADAVRHAILVWRRHLQNYYRYVQPPAFTQEITTRAPYLRRQLEGWQRKHETLMRQLEQICRQLRQRHRHLDDASPRLQLLLREILQHEEERDQLAYQSFYPEPAAMD